MEEKNVEELINPSGCIEAVRKFKSVRRAIRRGLVSPLGFIYPKRPFNNRKPTSGREENELKKKIYVRIHNRTKSL